MSAWAALEVCAGTILFLTVWAMSDRVVRMLRVRRRLERARQETQEKTVQRVKGQQEGDHGYSNASFCPDADDLALVAFEVSSRLRAGQSAAAAWRRTWTGREWGAAALDATGTPKDLDNPDLGRSRRKRHIVISAARALAAASRFSFLSGAPLADVLENMGQGIGANVRAHESQERAFAAPLLSARVLASLPVGTVILGEILGADSVSWLGGHPIGRFCLLVGTATLVAGLGLSSGLVARARRSARAGLDETVYCDLAAAGIRSGASIPQTLTLIASVTGRSELKQIAQQLIMGSPWGHAWGHAWGEEAELTILQKSLEPGWSDGVNPVPLLLASAQQVRERATASVEEDAAKLTVKLVIPLGALLLPSFVFLGVAPIVYSLMRGELGL